VNNYFDPQNTLVGETIGLLCWVSVRKCAKTPQGICPGVRVDNHERRKIEYQKIIHKCGSHMVLTKLK